MDIFFPYQTEANHPPIWNLSITSVRELQQKRKRAELFRSPFLTFARERAVNIFTDLPSSATVLTAARNAYFFLN